MDYMNHCISLISSLQMNEMSIQLDNQTEESYQASMMQYVLHELLQIRSHYPMPMLPRSFSFWFICSSTPSQAWPGSGAASRHKQVLFLFSSLSICVPQIVSHGKSPTYIVPSTHSFILLSPLLSKNHDPLIASRFF